MRCIFYAACIIVIRVPEFSRIDVLRRPRPRPKSRPGRPRSVELELFLVLVLRSPGRKRYFEQTRNFIKNSRISSINKIS